MVYLLLRPILGKSMEDLVSEVWLSFSTSVKCLSSTKSHLGIKVLGVDAGNVVWVRPCKSLRNRGPFSCPTVSTPVSPGPFQV